MPRRRSPLLSRRPRRLRSDLPMLDIRHLVTCLGHVITGEPLPEGQRLTAVAIDGMIRLGWVERNETGAAVVTPRGRSVWGSGPRKLQR